MDSDYDWDEWDRQNGFERTSNGFNGFASFEVSPSPASPNSLKAVNDQQPSSTGIALPNSQPHSSHSDLDLSTSEPFASGNAVPAVATHVPTTTFLPVIGSTGAQLPASSRQSHSLDSTRLAQAPLSRPSGLPLVPATTMATVPSMPSSYSSNTPVSSGVSKPTASAGLNSIPTPLAYRNVGLPIHSTLAAARAHQPESWKPQCSTQDVPLDDAAKQPFVDALVAAMFDFTGFKDKLSTVKGNKVLNGSFDPSLFESAAVRIVDAASVLHIHGKQSKGTADPTIGRDDQRNMSFTTRIGQICDLVRTSKKALSDIIKGDRDLEHVCVLAPKAQMETSDGYRLENGRRGSRKQGDQATPAAVRPNQTTTSHGWTDPFPDHPPRQIRNPASTRTPMQPDQLAPEALMPNNTMPGDQRFPNSFPAPIPVSEMPYHRDHQASSTFAGTENNEYAGHDMKRERESEVGQSFQGEAIVPRGWDCNNGSAFHVPGGPITSLSPNHQAIHPPRQLVDAQARNIAPPPVQHAQRHFGFPPPTNLPPGRQVARKHQHNAMSATNNPKRRPMAQVSNGAGMPGTWFPYASSSQPAFLNQSSPIISNNGSTIVTAQSSPSSFSYGDPTSTMQSMQAQPTMNGFFDNTAMPTNSWQQAQQTSATLRTHTASTTPSELDPDFSNYAGSDATNRTSLYATSEDRNNLPELPNRFSSFSNHSPFTNY